MIPYRDENVTQRTPYITIVIIALNVLIWVFFQGAGATFPLAKSICNQGLIPGELLGTLPVGSEFEMGNGLVCLTDPGHHFFNILTSMFLHGSWLHLIGNMWFFWIFGNNIEDSMGHARFVAFYLLSGIIAAMTQVLLKPDSIVPMVGASGAISGIMGAYLILYPRVRVYAIVPVLFFTIALPAWAMLGYWMLLQFLGNLQAAGNGGGVAFGAHLGGFVAGAVMIRFFRRRDYVEAHRGHWEPQRIGWR
jgi:rhomboid family protein